MAVTFPHLVTDRRGSKRMELLSRIMSHCHKTRNRTWPYCSVLIVGGVPPNEIVFIFEKSSGSFMPTAIYSRAKYSIWTLFHPDEFRGRICLTRFMEPLWCLLKILF